MLNRRHLRVKVLQSLYAFIQSGGTNLSLGEKELLFGIEKIFDLYLYQLSLIAEIGHQANRIIEDNKNKRVPSQEDLQPNTRFIENSCLQAITHCEELQDKLSQRGISWSENPDIAKKIFLQLKESKPFQKYLSQTSVSFEDDKEIVLKLLKTYMCEFELLHHFYEEKSIYWLDDWELVNKMLIKNIKSMEKASEFDLMRLYKDVEDKEFAKDLFKRTILNEKDLAPLIAAKTKNWEIERIALMDIIIMKMALTEILKFPNIPVKVSLNEYIELSKMYSTPKSKIFVNGVLDKLVEELKLEEKISKIKY